MLKASRGEPEKYKLRYIGVLMSRSMRCMATVKLGRKVDDSYVKDIV